MEKSLELERPLTHKALFLASGPRQAYDKRGEMEARYNWEPLLHRVYKRGIIHNPCSQELLYC